MLCTNVIFVFRKHLSSSRRLHVSIKTPNTYLERLSNSGSSWLYFIFLGWFLEAEKSQDIYVKSFLMQTMLHLFKKFLKNYIEISLLCVWGTAKATFSLNFDRQLSNNKLNTSRFLLDTQRYLHFLFFIYLNLGYTGPLSIYVVFSLVLKIRH